MNAPTEMTEAYDWNGRNVIGADGEKIGKADEVYYANDDGTPEWLTVNTGLFGTKTNFVPIDGSKPAGEDIQVAYTKDVVKDAPGVDPDGELSQSEERELWTHYGLEYGADHGHDHDQADTDAGHDASGPDTDDAMTRSEEEVSVGTRSQEGGRARLRKYVVTEQVTKTVPVRKEMATLETEPITEGNVDAATSGKDISEEEHEVVLSEEQVVVDKQVVPKERVRLGKETVTSDQEVTEEVRKERIETEGDVSSR
jgi:uncharacterized protein (TIGR02271 family)